MTEQKASYLTGILCQYKKDFLSDIYWDEICGIYSITDQAKSELDRNKINKNKITNVLAQRKCRGIGIHSQITTDKTGKNGDWTLETIADLISQYPSPSQLFDEALLNLSHKVDHPSDTISVNKQEVWYLYAFDAASALWTVKELESLGYAKILFEFIEKSIQFKIIAKGWSRISELQNKPNKESNQAFVAMWFNNEMNSYYQSIKEAIELDGTQCIRIDSEQHNNKICDEIIAQIRKSKYLVADFTGNRGGVYFEAGFALGLGIPVIWMVRNDYLEEIHFDTRQYNHIVYETEVDLKQQLKYRIQATIT
ncbi:MAG TPA: hypothetical protein PLV19_06305 [Nitrosomonas sp.]|nr:hypothetical protein [Nitrosomonas sp.]HQX13769.1 hypothetical protein [Nitrosomonas sp.]HRB32448.1 hypothetical protein [Nitrosomonas sp.]HRB45287.1 hypothetical protein [Nitrosomonas sp.]HRB76419.1 hypothetical protein [Nitrosomonas sp.]